LLSKKENGFGFSYIIKCSWSVEDNRHIHIGRNAFFKGTIDARSVTIEGKVRGEVNAADKILIREGGLVEGPIKTQKILLEEGASQNGRIILTDNCSDEVEDIVTGKENEQPEEEKPVPSDK
jgi:cytoskeletal protein CcmA (bactofilin family)